MNNIRIDNGRLFIQKSNIDKFENIKTQKEKLAKDLNIQIERLDKNKELINLLNGVYMFNENKSYTPLILKSKIMINSFFKF